MGLIQVTGTQVTVEYNEPTTTKIGTPLTDLKETCVYYDMGGGPVLEIVNPATSVNGGGSFSEQVIVPVQVDQESDVTLWVTAKDLVGNESGHGVETTVRIDRLSPAAPN